MRCSISGVILVAGALLYAVAAGLRVEKYVALAAGIQTAVFLAHGLPQKSERA